MYVCIDSLNFICVIELNDEWWDEVLVTVICCCGLCLKAWPWFTEGHHFLGCDVLQFGRYIPTVLTNILSSLRTSHR